MAGLLSIVRVWVKNGPTALKLLYHGHRNQLGCTLNNPDWRGLPTELHYTHCRVLSSTLSILSQFTSFSSFDVDYAYHQPASAFDLCGMPQQINLESLHAYTFPHAPLEVHFWRICNITLDVQVPHKLKECRGSILSFLSICL